ncbi:unnamed protein product, partial [Rotaria sp. Silwood2]
MVRKKSSASKVKTRKETYKRKQHARSYASRSWRILLLTVRAVQKFSSFRHKNGVAMCVSKRFGTVKSDLMHQVDEYQLIDFFEKPNDEHSTSEIINVKNEICNISQESTTLKVGTKTKLVSLLKSAQFIVKKKKFLVLSQARSNRLDNHRSSLSSTDNNGTDSEVSKENYRLSIEESIEKLLKKINYNIHGNYYTNISTKDFKVIIENTIDSIVPTCSIECICNERIKLYLKSYRFQLSNLMKHLKVINNKPILLINNRNQQLDGSSNVVNQMNFDDQALRNESSRPTTQNYSIQHHTNDSDLSASVTIKKTLSQNNKNRAESNNRSRDLLATIKKNQHRSSNNYRYSIPVLRFATCLFILAGIYVYEYIRLNLKF